MSVQVSLQPQDYAEVQCNPAKAAAFASRMMKKLRITDLKGAKEDVKNSFRALITGVLKADSTNFFPITAAGTTLDEIRHYQKVLGKPD